MSRKSQHRCHGDPDRFEILADTIYDRYGSQIHYIADVAGGQGLLSRMLNKRYNYHSEVIDPRGHALKGVDSQDKIFEPEMALFYDLVVGLHPDEATRAVAEAALYRPTILIPCCNFWSEEKLGRDELVEAVEGFYLNAGIRFERVTFSFKGPKNVGLVTQPPPGS
jgi:hypothetical protein